MRLIPALLIFPALGACTSQEPAAERSANAITIEGNAAEMVIPQPARPGNASDAAATPALNLAPDGLSVMLQSGAARHLAFGMPQESTLRAVASAVGEPTSRRTEEECPGGPLEIAEFDGGLTLSFGDGRFIGWDLNSREDGRYTTAAGIGLGSTRQQLENAIAIEVEQSSLGHEFHSGQLSGLLGSPAPSGKVTALWAGTTCIFR